MNENNGLPLVAPKIAPKLDPNFRPAVLANREYQKRVEESGQAVPLEIAIERNESSVSRYSTKVFPTEHPSAKGNFTYIERLIKFLLWSQGGKKIYIHGPVELTDALSRIHLHYS